MKTMRLGKCFLSTGIMAFLLFFTGNAFGVNANRSCDNGAVITGGVAPCPTANNFTVISPYWQVDSGSYTFIAVTHSSLSGMASQIGLRVNAITSAGAAYDTAESFTIFSGNTERLFIVPSTHSSVNATAIPTAKFLAGTSDFTYGSVRVEPVMTHPGMKYSQQHRQIYNGDGFRDITMLSYWGSVIIEANTTGFAMEFLGDMNDSVGLNAYTHQWFNSDGSGTNAGELGTESSREYQIMSTGPNLQ
jgi:hypothetical protein